MTARDLEWTVVRTGENGQDDALRGVVLDGRYELVERIARGGMATVYRAHDERLDRWVAVKVMHAAFADDPEFVARFTREARSAARLSSAEVVAVYDQGHDVSAGVVYLVMELVRGRDLRALMREHGALPPERALAVLEPVLSALAAAHAAGIVHRDVKPENVLLGDDGRIKVADFGLARAVEASSVTATTGLIIGTVAYLAPEQIEHGVSEPRTDVYAAGILLWEMLVGHAPVTGDTPVAVLFSHVNRDVPPASTQVGGISPALDDLVVRATRRDPARRPLDAGAFLAEVRALRRQLPAAPSPTERLERRDTLVVPTDSAPRQRTTAMPPRRPPVPAQQRGWFARRRRGLIAAALVLVLGAGAGVSGWWYASGRYTSAPSVVQLDEQTARETLERRGFEVEVTTAFDNVVTAGSVIEQDPGPRDRVLRNGTISLVISKGKDLRTVPALVGLTREAATRALTAQGLKVGQVTEQFSAKRKGTVIEAGSQPGDELLRGTSVALTLSKGIEQLPLPSGLVGMERQAALDRLSDSGFVPQPEEAFSEDVPAGRVISTDPSSGNAGRLSGVTVVVSKGPALREIPRGIVGSSLAEARSRLEALDLVVDVRSFGFFPRGGEVLSVEPREGTRVERGSTVVLFAV